MEKYLPYIVSVVCALLSGLTSYLVARKQTKADLHKLEKQHELDMENAQKMFEMEKEKIEIEHKHQLELIQKEAENKLGSDLTNLLFSEAFKLPEIRQQLSNGIKASNKNRRKH